MTKPLNVYVDTSVFGGCFDVEFEKPTRSFFELIKSQKFKLTTSVLIEQELIFAPDHVRVFFNEMLPYADIIAISGDALSLRDAYINAQIVTRKSLTDALHVAVATISQCNMVVSWNFKHIVHFQKIPLYNAINMSLVLHSINYS